LKASAELRSGLDGIANAHFGDRDAAAGNDPALAGQTVDRRRREDRHVEGFAAFDPLGQPTGGAVVDDEPVAAGSLEAVLQRQHDRLHGAGRQYLDLGRRGRAGVKQHRAGKEGNGEKRTPGHAATPRVGGWR
jgi:hypothetical protein